MKKAYPTLVIAIATLCLGCNSTSSWNRYSFTSPLSKPLVGAEDLSAIDLNSSTTKVAGDSSVQPAAYFQQEADAQASNAQPDEKTPQGPTSRTVETLPKDVESQKANQDSSAISHLSEPYFGNSLSLAEIEQLAIENHPGLAAAIASLDALRGVHTQVGLRPNPEFGYFGETGDSGTAGQQGLYLNREFVRGGKLEKNRAIVCAELSAAEQAVEMQRQKVLTDVRVLYYMLLVAQRKVEVTQQYLTNTQNAVAISKKKLEAGEIAEIALLQTKLQQNNADVLLRQAQTERTGITRRLNALLGDSFANEQTSVTGNFVPVFDDFDTLALTEQLLASSPEIAKKHADLQREHQNLNRQIAEQTPNFFLQSSMRHNLANDEEYVGIQFGRPIQTNNWNQGNIRAAQSKIIAASQVVERTRRDISQRAAVGMQNLANAKVRIERYQSEILPTAQRVIEIAENGFTAGETDYLDLITAQKTFIQANLDYTAAIGDYWTAYCMLDGFLLSGSLQDTAQ